jgi:hypothetical protein
MSVPVFLHVMSNGDLWVSNNVNDTPTGTVTGTYRFLDDAAFQKIGTLSGTISSSLVAGSKTGKYGKEIT